MKRGSELRVDQMAKSKGTMRIFWENIFPYEVHCGIEKVPKKAALYWTGASKKQKKVSDQMSPPVSGSASKVRSPFAYHS